jgi:hypothetical protein
MSWQKQTFIIYRDSALGGRVGKDKMSNSCWPMFSAVGMAFTIQIVPKCRAKTKRIHDRALFVDNDKYERWIHCLAEFVRSVKCQHRS